MESQNYKLGEVVIREGEPQKYLYIVAEGRCKFVKEEIFVRDKKSIGLEVN